MPVIIVGNITVGGTGKTPLVIYLTNFLIQKGFRPGIISRGYKGKAKLWPQLVNELSDPHLVGDEPVLLAKRCQCALAVGPNRIESANLLIQENNCNIIIADDGLQHYRLARDIEIAVVDGRRRFGNGHCLPAGPLREPVSRMQQVDIAVINGGSEPFMLTMNLAFTKVSNLLTPGLTKELYEFKETNVHVIAGIGNPDRFFNQLAEAGISIVKHAFSDHHNFTPEELIFNDNWPVIMTEKDAVKCRQFAQKNYWYISVDAVVDSRFNAQILAKIGTLNG